MAISFRRTPNSNLFLLKDDRGPLVPGVGYYLSDGMTISSNELSLLDMANLSAGSYIFIDQPLASEQKFADALKIYFAQPARTGIHFLWTTNANNLDYGLIVKYLKASYRSDLQQYLTTELKSFDLRNISLLIGRDCPIKFNGTLNLFEIRMPADDTRRIYLTNKFGAQSLFLLDPLLTIPLTGDLAGTLQFSLSIKNSHLDDLDVGLRLFFDDQIYENFLTSQRYPIFNLATNIIKLRANFDLLDPLNSKRTFFSFIDQNNSINNTAISSYYRTNLGYSVSLTAQNNSSRLNFAARTLAAASNNNDPLYLVPRGDYAVKGEHTQNINVDDNLLCGISGIEYFKLPQTTTSLIRFIAAQPAYAPLFTPGVALQSNDDLDQLTGTATTSWAYNWQLNGAAIYYAQPEEAILYKGSDASSSNPAALYDNILDYMEAPAAALPTPPALNGSSANTNVAAFPLLPYGGLAQQPLANYQQMEVQLINPLRRALIHQIGLTANNIPLSNATGDSFIGVTPQGLMVNFSAHFEQIHYLTLALDTANQQLQLQNIDRQSPLRSALQSNQLFMVISNPLSLKNYFANNQLTIQDWQFDLNPDSWQKQGTILIFKFFNKSLMELLNNNHYWSSPDQFNSNKNSTKVKLINLFQMAIDKTSENASAKDQENYHQMAFAATNENWSGIIALNVNITPSNIPPELRGISAGIDDSKFFAQYLGVELSPITEQAGNLVMGQSSLFGLIDYHNDQAPASTDSGYNFQVMSLMVLFQNSRIKAFSSEIAVVLDKLFDEQTQLSNSELQRNIILLKGTAEDHDGHTTYSYSFSGINSFITANSVALDRVDIIKAQFVTDPIANPTDPAAIITGRFTFWGQLNYKLLTKFDILSFGAESEDDTTNSKYLSFSNLILTMTFAQNDREHKTFNFDPTRMGFDLVRSAVRTGSLYNHFPLKFSEFIFSNDGKKPADAGYLTVKSPLSGNLANNWYAMTFDLELGTLGALASQAGVTVKVMAAWSAGTDGKGIFVGLKLPGTNGGKTEFSLQGIIKLGFKSIEFIVGDNNGQPSYLLKLKNIGLKFFVLTFPPNAQTEIIIFGNPQSGGDNNAVGWYAAYAKE